MHTKFLIGDLQASINHSHDISLDARIVLIWINLLFFFTLNVSIETDRQAFPTELQKTR
jgi:hypothetical protein